MKAVREFALAQSKLVRSAGWRWGCATKSIDWFPDGLSPEGKYVEAVGDAHIVPPRVGRHVRFDGRLLHGAPLELLEARADESPYVRVTFLVNIWIGHKPGGCARYRPPHSAVAISRTPVRLRAAAATTAARRVRGSCLKPGSGILHRLAVDQTREKRELRLPVACAAIDAMRRGQVVRLAFTADPWGTLSGTDRIRLGSG